MRTASATIATDEPITPAQRRSLFGWAGRRGLDIDDLRAATPLGSISKLTRAQAAELIELLSGRPGTGDPIGPSGSVTPRQLGLLMHLQERAGLPPAAFETWLLRHFAVRSFREVTDKARASQIIAALLNMLQTREARR